MMIKLSTFRGVSPDGEPLVRVFHPGDPLIKTAGSMMTDVQDWLRSYKPVDNKVALLVNAMGASEYWGENINGDIFYWSALTHDCRRHEGQWHPIDSFTGKPIPPYGYWTFLQAHPFVHHRNKDPNRAFGQVVVSCLNPKMRRVELVVLLDRSLALQHGAQGVIDKIDAGDYPDVSMGCRVPYDRCSICGNRSKTRNDYCSCIKHFGMGRILEDGRQVGVINDYPRFFDISFVFIGADKTAKVMAKLGSGSVLSADEGMRIYGEDSDGLVKAACGKQECSCCSGKCKTASVPSVLVGEADKKNFSIGDADPKQLARGIEVEKEHTPDKKVSRKIALDHLAEIPDYYTRLDQMEREAKTASGWEIEPPPVPNRDPYPYVGTIRFRGLKIFVETGPGDVRRGKDPDGKEWKTTMHVPYGEILGTKGTDKDRLDVYVGPNMESDEVYVVHQNHPAGHPKAGQYDEDKVMLGFGSPEDAKGTYLRHYDDSSFYRSMTTMSFQTFLDAAFGDAKGEKVAALEKIASDLKLEDLFSSPNFLRRERRWTDTVTGVSSTKTGSGLGDSFDTMFKTASAKVARNKNAEIEKEIPPSRAVGKVSPLLSEREEDLPNSILDTLASSGLQAGLATPSVLGISLKPREFQRMVLIAAKKPDVANKLDQQGIIFSPTDGEETPCPELHPDDVQPDVLESLLPFLENRSYLGPVLRRRIIKLTICAPSKKVLTEDDSPLLSKVSAAYNWYRKEMVKMATYAPQFVASNPELSAKVHGVTEADVFSKAAALTRNQTWAVVGSIPLALLYSSHLRGKERKGQQLGVVERLVADHPILTAMGSAAATRHLVKHPTVTRMVRGGR